MRNRKRRQVLRRGPRIVLLPALPDAFLNLSPQRALGPVVTNLAARHLPFRLPGLTAL